MKLVAMLAALLVFALPVAAHEAGPPRAWETRVAHDCVDDYQGGDSTSKDGLDMHTVDIAEKYDAALGEVISVSAVYSGGYTGSDRPTLGIEVELGGQTYATTTTNPGAFPKGSFDRVLTPAVAKNADGQTDGERRIFEGWIKASKVSGSSISGYEVRSTLDGDVIDTVPGDDTSLIQDCESEFGPQTYKLRGSGYYTDFSITKPTKNLPLETEVRQDVEVKNRLQANQKLTISLAGASGVEARFHGPGSDYHTSPHTFDLASGQTTSFHLALMATESDVSGVITVTLVTDKGGRDVVSVPYATGAATIPDDPDPVGGPGTPGGEEDAPALPLLAVLALLVVLVKRR